MSDVKLHPIFQVRGMIGTPEHPPFNLYITSDARWEEAKKKGGIQNLRRYLLDGVLKDDQRVEDAVENRNRAVSLDYTLPPQDEYNTVAAWEMIPTPAEQFQLELQISEFQTRLDEVNEQIGTETPTAEQAELVRDTTLVISQLKRLRTTYTTGTVGYLEETPSVFGYGGKSIHDLNGAPNIDKIRRSTFALDRDRPFHLALRFAEPHENQRPTSFKIRWDIFTLEFRGGDSVLFSAYDKAYLKKDGTPDLARIEAAENELNGYLDQGRLTAEDMDNIQIAQTEIRRLKLEARTLNIKTEDDAYKPYEAQIQSLQDAIQARRKFKRKMPNAAYVASQRLKKELYGVYEERVNLQENSENFYGDEGIVRLTVIPQQRGYISFVLNGGQPATVEIPDILETRKYGYVWNKSRILFQSNGGGVDWQFLYPNVQSRGEYRLKSVPVPFEIGDEEIIHFSGDWTGQTRSIPGSDGETYFVTSALPGAGIAFKVVASADFTPAQPRYDFIALIRSDIGRSEDAKNKNNIQNAYIPFLYSLNAFINAGVLPDRTEVVWDSQTFGQTLTWTPGFANPNRDNPILDATVSYDDITQTRRGLHLSLDIHDPEGTADFKGYTDHWCDFKVGLWQPPTFLEGSGEEGDFSITWPLETEGGVSGIVDYYSDCIIREAVLMNARNCGETDETFRAKYYGVDSFWRLRVEDIWSLLDEFVLPCDIILDGLTLGAAIRTLAKAKGIPDSKLTGVQATGIFAGGTIQRAGAGEPPRKVAPRGTRAGLHITELMDEYGMTDDFRELRLRCLPTGLSLDVPSLVSSRAQSSADSAQIANVIRAGAQHIHDWSRFYNIYHVEGKKDKRTGEPIKASYPIPESWLPGYENHPLHVGYEKEYPVVKRPELDTAEDVQRAVVTLALRNSKSGKLRSFDISWFYPPVYVGDTVTPDESDFELIRIGGMNLKGITQASIAVRPRVELP